MPEILQNLLEKGLNLLNEPAAMLVLGAIIGFMVNKINWDKIGAKWGDLCEFGGIQVSNFLFLKWGEALEVKIEDILEKIISVFIDNGAERFLKGLKKNNKKKKVKKLKKGLKK